MRNGNYIGKFARLCLTPAVLCLFSVSSLSAAVSYTVKDLGTLGGTSSYGININSAGEAVGLSMTAEYYTHAYLYDGATMRDLGTLSSTAPYYSGAFGINDAGDVVGTAMNSTYQGQAFYYNRTAGTMTAIPTLGGMSSDAYGINSSGLVAGYSTVTTDSELHGFVYNTATAQLTPIGQLSGYVSSLAYGINDSGKVVGNCFNSSAAAQGFIYDHGAGTMTGIGTLIAGGQSTARNINNAGLVVGTATIAGGREIAISYDSNTGVMSQLGTLGGNASEAVDVNSFGHIVGNSYTSSGANVAMIYRDGTMFDLNTLVADMPAGGTLTLANGINDLGQIICTGMNGGASHAYLLTPVPEPSTLALLAAGLLGLLAYAWRKRK